MHPALRGLAMWTSRQWLVALGATVGMALLIGGALALVLIVMALVVRLRGQVECPVPAR